MHDVHVQIFKLKATMGQASLSPHVIPSSLLHHGDASSSRQVPLAHSPFQVESREETKEIDEESVNESSKAYSHEYEVYEK